MLLSVPRLFQDNNIFLCALPSKISGKKHPLDLMLFSVLKAELRQISTDCIASNGSEPFAIFDF